MGKIEKLNRDIGKLENRIMLIEEELDRVLEKIHREGIRSLTAREKEILRRASERTGE